MEMESLMFAALSHHAGIRGAVVCVTLLDRLEGDQVGAELPDRSAPVTLPHLSGGVSHVTPQWGVSHGTP